LLNRPTSLCAQTISDRAAPVTVGIDFTTAIPAHRHPSTSVADSGNDSGTPGTESNSVYIPISTELPSRTTNISGRIRVNTDAQSGPSVWNEPADSPDINRPYTLGRKSGNRKELADIQEKVTKGATTSRGTPAPFLNSFGTTRRNLEDLLPSIPRSLPLSIAGTLFQHQVGTINNQEKRVQEKSFVQRQELIRIKASRRRLQVSLDQLAQALSQDLVQ
jgi:hypothetical protein